MHGFVPVLPTSRKAAGEREFDDELVTPMLP